MNRKKLKNLGIIIISCLFLFSCGKGFFKGADAKKYPPDPNLSKENLKKAEVLDLIMLLEKLKKVVVIWICSSNELWRASLDVLDFTLVSANYSGGIIITDWY